MEFLNINTEINPKKWILGRCALEIQKYYPKTTINNRHRAVNYYLGYMMFSPPKRGICVGLYTHLEEAGLLRSRFLSTIPYFDHYIVLCEQVRDILLNQGVEAHKITQIVCGIDERLRKTSVTFGVIGRTYKSGRKGEFLVAKAIAAGYNLKVWGVGWPVKNVHNVVQDQKWDRIPDFYKSIDYLLIPSLNEGGPVPVIDAIAAGVPVIAPRNVGWCDEFPCIRYDKGDWDSLNMVLHKLTNPPTWKNWANNHAEVFHKLRTT